MPPEPLPPGHFDAGALRERLQAMWQATPTGVDGFAVRELLSFTNDELQLWCTLLGGEKHLPRIVASVSQAYALMRCAACGGEAKKQSIS